MEMDKGIIKVFLAEDHVVVREGLREFISKEEDMAVIGEAGDGRETVQLVEDLRPDIVLMDIAMPSLNGIEAIQQIKEKFDDICIIVLTAYDNPEFILAAIKYGAAGYLLKNARSKEVINAIRAAHEGDAVLHPAIAQKVFAQLQIEEKSQPAKTEFLSHRELEVLRLAENGLGNKQIATELSIGIRTIQTHWRNIFNKLGVSSRTEAIIKCLKTGWLSIEEDEELP